MNFKDTLGEKWIRLFIHPLKPDAPLSFQSQLAKSKSVVIACPPGDSIRLHRDAILQLLGLFNNRGVVVCDDIGTGRPEAVFPSPVRVLSVPKMSRWKLLHSGLFKELYGRFDAFIDLDPAYSLRHILLARTCSPPLRIGFTKERSDAHYNLQYGGQAGDAYEKRLLGMYRFLKQFYS
jgi:hypothetical protein